MKLTVKKIKKEAEDSFSIIFDKPKNFQFYPGQYLDMELPVEDPRSQTRIMSISSSPSEDFLMITYIEGISPYKIAMQNLRPGDIVESSHPAGTVVIDDSSPLVFLAGGVGIAPHRSMIKWAVDQKLDLPITLIYSNSGPDFIFKKELDQWQKQFNNLTIYYVVTSKDGRLSDAKLATAVGSLANKIFYLAGSPGMVDDFENVLLKMGIDSTNIRTDRFDGY